MIAVYDRCSSKIQEGIRQTRTRQLQNQFFTEQAKEDVAELVSEISYIEGEKAVTVAISVCKLLLDIIAFVCLLFILILHHRYLIGLKLYEFELNKRPNFGLNLFSTEKQLRDRINNANNAEAHYKEQTPHVHWRIIRQAIGGITDLLFIGFFLCQIISPWRIAMTMGTCSRKFREISSLPRVHNNFYRDQLQIDERMGEIRRECSWNLIMSILDLFGLVLMALNSVAVWRFYYQIFIIKTVIKAPHQEVVSKLRVWQSHHRFNMLIYAEFQFFGDILIDLLFLPFFLVIAITPWNYGRLYHWLRLSKGEDFDEHRSIVFHLFIIIVSGFLAVASWIFGIGSLLRIRTFIRFAKIIRRDHYNAKALRKSGYDHKEEKELAISSKTWIFCYEGSN